MRSGGILRECEYLAKRRMAAGEHHEPVESDRDPRASRQSRLMGRDEPSIDVRSRSSRPAARLDVAPDPAKQLCRILKFMVAVGNFDSVDIQLESLRDLRGSRANLRKRRLGRREVKQVDTSGAKSGLHCAGEEIVEAFVASGGRGTTRKSTRPACVVKFRHRRGKRIEIQMTQESVSERHAPRRLRTENPVEQCVDIRDEEVMIESDPVPLQNRELRVVVPATLPVAERTGDLVDGPAARRKQTFHRELGRCLKVPDTSPALVCNETLNRWIGDRVGTQNRRLDLHHTLGVHVRPHCAKNTGPQSNGVDTGARTPVAA